MNDIRQKSIDILDQLGSLLSRLPSEAYASPLSCLQQNSLGKHVRHIVEFFECLLEGIPSGQANYDLRRRNLLMETDPAYTLLRISKVQQEITGLEDGPFVLQADLGSGSREFQSSVFREMAFVMDHCIHHLALIRVGLQQHFPEIPMEEEIGIAFSTLQYLQERPA